MPVPTIRHGRRSTTRRIPNHLVGIASGATLAIQAAILLVSRLLVVILGAFEGAAAGTSPEERIGGNARAVLGTGTQPRHSFGIRHSILSVTRPESGLLRSCYDAATSIARHGCPGVVKTGCPSRILRTKDDSYGTKTHDGDDDDDDGCVIRAMEGYSLYRDE